MDTKRMAHEATKRLKEMDLSEQETQQLADAFQKEEFREMFHQYMEEISDPQNRRVRVRNLVVYHLWLLARPIKPFIKSYGVFLFWNLK